MRPSNRRMGKRKLNPRLKISFHVLSPCRTKRTRLTVTTSPEETSSATAGSGRFLGQPAFSRLSAMCASARANRPVLKSTARANGLPAAATNITPYAPMTTSAVESTATPSISRARERISSSGVSMEEGMLPRPGARVQWL